MARSARNALLLGLIASALTAVGPPAVSADHHLVSIREVFPGSTIRGNNSEFVELQLYADGQNVFTGQNQQVRFYDAAGVEQSGYTFASNPANAGSQFSVLIGTPEAASDFGVPVDNTMINNSHMDPSGGAVCFTSTFFGFIDCVSWGSFDNMTPTLPVGTNETAIPDESSIERSIAPGCSTLLEAGDDTGNSATDFAPATPSPRNNSATPTEAPCTPPAGGGSVVPVGGNRLPPAGVPKKKCKKRKRSAAAAKKCRKKK
jgi:hypothetical protein